MICCDIGDVNAVCSVLQTPVPGPVQRGGRETATLTVSAVSWFYCGGRQSLNAPQRGLGTTGAAHARQNMPVAALLWWQDASLTEMI